MFASLQPVAEGRNGITKAEENPRTRIVSAEAKEKGRVNLKTARTNGKVKLTSHSVKES